MNLLISLKIYGTILIEMFKFQENTIKQYIMMRNG